MPLLDHFHPPLSVRRHWQAFYTAWATHLAARLNRLLPEGQFAEPKAQFGIETNAPFSILSDEIEVSIYEDGAARALVGVVEIVTPANKAPSMHREAFVEKCIRGLRQGVGLVLVDIVTDGMPNLYDQVLETIGLANAEPRSCILFASAIHPIAKGNKANLDIWHELLAIGQELPTLPLWLKGAICLPLELEAAYALTCKELKVAEW